MKKVKNIDKLIICIVITILILTVSIIFTRSYVRLWESIKDLGLSIYYYFCELFEIERKIEPTVISIGKFDEVHPEFILSILNFKTIGTFFELGFTSLVNGENIVKYFEELGLFLANFSQILLLILPIILIGVMLIKRYLSTQIKGQNEDSKPLKLYKRVVAKIYTPIKNYILNFKEYLLNHRYYILIWVIAFSIYFNFITIII